MTATRWSSLTGLCLHLGREGKAIVDETEKGWFIQYIDRNPTLIAKQREAELRQRAEIDEDERNKRMIELQIRSAHERLKETGGELQNENDHSLIRTEDSEKIGLSLNTVSGNGSNTLLSKKRPIASVNIFQQSIDSDEEKEKVPHKKSAVEQLIEDEQKKKQSKIDSICEKKSYWLHKNIFVKILNKNMEGGGIYKKKGLVIRVIDNFVAVSFIKF